MVAVDLIRSVLRRSHASVLMSYMASWFGSLTPPNSVRINATAGWRIGSPLLTHSASASAMGSAYASLHGRMIAVLHHVRDGSCAR